MKSVIVRSLNSRLLSAVLTACLGFGLLVSARAGEWQPLKIGGGGWIVGIAASPAEKDLVFCRSDVGGAYRWVQSENRWKNVVTTNSLPVEENSLKYKGVDSIVGAPSDPGRAYMAFHDTVWSSDDQGETWKAGSLDVPMEPNGEGRLRGERLAVDPANKDRVFYGSLRSGLYRSSNGGVDWVRTTVPQGGAHGVVAVLFNPTSREGELTKTVHAVLDGQGVWESKDAGETWSAMPDAPQGAVFDAEIAGDGTIYLAGKEGCWRHRNGEWTLVNPGFPFQSDAGELAVDPRNPDHLFIFSWSKHAESRDAGESWTDVKVRYTSPDIAWHEAEYADRDHMVTGGVVFDPHREGVLWFGEGWGAWRCDNASAAPLIWRSVSMGIEDVVPYDLIATPGGGLVTAMMDIGVFVHDDPAKYTAVAPIANGIYHTWDLDYCWSEPTFLAQVNTRLFGDQPPWTGYSTDGGKTWTRFASFPVQKEGSIAVAANDSKNMVCSTKDGGVPIYFSTDRGETWTVAQGLPKGEREWLIHNIAADKVAPHTFYAYLRGEEGGFYASTDGGRSWEMRSDMLPTWLHSPSIATLPEKAGHILFCGSGQDLFLSTDGGVNFEKVAGLTKVERVAAGKSAPGSSHSAIYVWGDLDQTTGLHRSNDGGSTWETVTTKIPLGIFSKIDCMDADKEKYGVVYVGLNSKGFARWEPSDSAASLPPLR